MFTASTNSTEFLLLILAKGALLATSGCLVYASLRRAPAALRHLLLLMTVGGLLVLPILAAVLPTLALPLLPASESQARIPGATAPSTLPPLSTPEFPGIPMASKTPPGQPDVQAPPRPTPLLSQAPLPVLLYALGIGLALLPTALGLFGILRLRRRSTVLNSPEWIGALEHAKRELNFAHHVRLLLTPAMQVPATWGFRRHVIALPADAESWTPERRRVVLLHELAHAQRRDFVAHLLGRVAVTLHWPNPLAWYALRRMAIERERACDDVVLNAGIVPSEYAQHLLDIVRSLRRIQLLPTPAIAMAHSSNLETRLKALVDSKLEHGGVRRRTVAACVLAKLAIVALLAPTILLAAQEENAPYTAEVGSGAAKLSITLECLRELGKPVFWKPNGELIPEPEARKYNASINIGASENMTPYEFIFTLHGGPTLLSNLKFMARTKDGEDAVPFAGGGTGDGTSMTLLQGISLDSAAEEVTVIIGSGLEEWKSLITASPLGNGSQRVNGGTVMWTSQDTDTGLSIVIAETFTGSAQRLSARDWSGKVLQAVIGGSTNTGLLRQTDFQLSGVKVGNLQDFTYEIAPYEWTELPAVQLRPRAPGAAAQQPSKLSRTDALKRLGVALKRSAHDQAGARYPVSTGPSREFLLDTAMLATYLDDQTRKALQDDPPVYLGHLVTTQQGLNMLLKAYADLGEDAVVNSDISWPRAQNAEYYPPPSRLREGIERFLITDINNPAASAMAQSTVPIAWHLPAPDDDGGPVLFMDGHVTIKRGEFPLSEDAIAALRQLPSVSSAVTELGAIAWSVKPLAETPQGRRMLDGLSSLLAGGQPGASRHNPTAEELAAQRVKFLERPDDQPIGSVEDALREFGLSFKLCAANTPGEFFPPTVLSGLSAQPARFLPERIEEKYLSKGLHDFIEAGRLDSTVYLGHIVTDESEVLALLRALAKDADAARTKDIPYPQSMQGAIPRTREGVERFYITDINDPAQSARYQGEFPVLWSLPDESGAAWVLYMDGHVARVKQGEFPVTDTLVRAIQEFPNLSWLPSEPPAASEQGAASDAASSGVPAVKGGFVVDTALGSVSADRVTIDGGKATFQGNVRGSGSILRDFSASTLSIDASTGAAQMTKGKISELKLNATTSSPIETPLQQPVQLELQTR